jgi:endogenous inhibitor of DNA gyrase (YacG/DUF329 family)
MKRRCPICQKEVSAEQQRKNEEAGFFPFCSQRCKLIDLGAWLDAEYRVTAKPCPPSDVADEMQ